MIKRFGLKMNLNKITIKKTKTEKNWQGKNKSLLGQREIGKEAAWPY